MSDIDIPEVVDLDETVVFLLELMDSTHRGMKERALRISKASGQIADAMAISKVQSAQVSLAGKLSLLGLTSTNSDVLLKRSDLLSKEEEKQIQRYPKQSAKLLKHITGFNDVAEYILHQRDSFKATVGLAGKDIPLESRILSTVTKFDYLLHPLHCKLPASVNLAMKKILSESSELDPDIVNIFVNNVLPPFGYEKTTEVPLRLTDLKEKMVLSRNILDEHGNTLVNSGAMINAEMLDLLNQVEELHKPDSLIFLSRNSVAPHNSCSAPALPTPIIDSDEDIKKKIIIVVDDESGIVDTLKWQLKRASYNVAGFTDPLLALKHAEGKDVFVVISDLNMPLMKGDVFIDEIQKISPNTPCIIITGHTTKDNITKLRKASNLNRILPKPWSEQTLLDTVSSVKMNLNRCR